MQRKVINRNAYIVIAIVLMFLVIIAALSTVPFWIVAVLLFLQIAFCMFADLSSRSSK